MNYQLLIDKAAQFVIEYFDEHSFPQLLYHNAEHASYLVKAVKKIAGSEDLTDEEYCILLIAAWFHDTGFTEYEGAQEASAEIASTFLEKYEAGNIADAVAALIFITKREKDPDNLLEQIMCDADTFHFGRKSFFKKDENLLKESEATKQIKYDKSLWTEETIMYVENHRYYTRYCNQNLNKQKEKNLTKLKEALLTMHKEKDKTVSKPNIQSKKTEDKDKSKSIDTMFKIATSNSQRISSMADNKAHILITVNSIILSAVISLLLRKLSQNSYLIIPTLIMLAVCLSSMIFSILSVRPALPKKLSYWKKWKLSDLNLLYFGNYYNMDLEEYTSGMRDVMINTEAIYDTLIEDIYIQGKVLGKKYYLLRTAYNIFMFGMGAVVVAFSIASILYS